ncbi:mitochondrial ribonuclease P catalytic subunit isoform X2 [Echinops telfairi]|uniref:Mitochondrial ribonuclease P catalytic subunit isoform X2 n=1 Tax=Echinops telfairi TaxID=9371 RepID=A0AC55CX76_ECHTE|nr:mitochondrial ribonuclease P catalytic subunit isoform X2 [Echinops telfairi]
MAFCLSGFRSFPKLWKNNLSLGSGPANSLFCAGHCAFRSQQRWLCLTTVSPQNTNATNLLIAKTRYGRKKDEGNNKQAASDSHLFAAGAAKKRSQMNPSNKDPIPPSQRNSMQLPTKPLTSEEWEKLKEDYKGRANFETWISAQLTHQRSSVNVAKSLLAWAAAKNNGIVSYDLLVKYLYLCIFHEQTSEIIDVYEIMKARYKILEQGGYTLLIRGLILADRWREALLLLEDVKKVMVPSKKNYDDCIRGAFLHQDVNTAWKLYQELLGYNLIPMLETLKAFFDFGKDIKDDQYANKLQDILLYLRNNQCYPGESFAHSIKTWFESIPGEQWKGQFTTIQKSGQCLSCGKMLESIYLTPEEYEFLKENIMRNVIDGGDQYKKTTPKLLDVVTHLANQNLRLLVLGRKHMLTPGSRWKKDEMEKVQRQASCFFADNISKDDPFLLYATLHSGNHCKFITKDLMRDHKACLPDAKTQRLFFKWQQGHQLAIISRFPGSKITFQHVLRYDTVVQTTGDSWHIPYDEDQVERYSYEVPNKWLCLHRKT